MAERKSCERIAAAAAAARSAGGIALDAVGVKVVAVVGAGLEICKQDGVGLARAAVKTWYAEAAVESRCARFAGPARRGARFAAVRFGAFLIVASQGEVSVGPDVSGKQGSVQGLESRAERVV